MTSDSHVPADLANLFAAIDAANSHDPETTIAEGRVKQAAVVYGERMSERMSSFSPGASLALQIAARGQHIERWMIPRNLYPQGRIGYLAWRKELQRHHARRLGEIVLQGGHDDALAERVGQLARKERLASDPEVQILEDIACLVFLDHYFDPFAAGQTDDKLADIVAKTWRKMSERAQEAVVMSSPPQRILDLLAAGTARLQAIT